MNNDSPKTVYQQATTGVLHLRKSCSITSRTRYDHFEVEFNERRRANSPRCAKCWDGFTPEAVVVTSYVDDQPTSEEDAREALDASPVFAGFTPEARATIARNEPTRDKLSAEAARDVALYVTVLQNDLNLDSDEALEALVTRNVITYRQSRIYRERYFAVAKHLRAVTDSIRSERVI